MTALCNLFAYGTLSPPQAIVTTLIRPHGRIKVLALLPVPILNSLAPLLAIRAKPIFVGFFIILFLALVLNPHPIQNVCTPCCGFPQLALHGAPCFA